jgi:hypothetical protein
VPASDDGPAELPGGAWSVCPYGVLRGVQFRAVQTLAACGRVSPIAGWPWSIPAWLSWGVTVYQARVGGEK